ncbi:MAG: hypothetical protein CL843_15655 [Crocinitomicaceae bacterium]|nr:hypothetical protein [Crocinitomicaceae bacterium]|tara:strand:+ start:9612 stop:10748 length:1137 start_codon:yes stop_codon:yes gene_type:complete
MKKACVIAHYGEDYFAYREQFLSYLKNELNIDGIGVVPEDDYSNKRIDSQFKTYSYKYQRNWKFLFYIIIVISRFKQIFKRENPDLVFTYKFFPNLIGVPIAKRSRVSVVAATIAGIGFLENRDSSLLIKILFKIYVKSLNNADYVIIQNRDDFEMFKKYLIRPKFILTNGSGVDKSRFENIETNEVEFIKRNSLPTNKKFIVFCSRIVRSKGIFELIKGYKMASEKSILKYNLIIAGWFDEAGIEEEVKKEINEIKGIHLLGYQKDVVSLIDLASCVILPSYYPEGVPRSLTESLAMGKPIITTNHKGCRETCIDGENGYLIEPKSAIDIRETILKFNSLNDLEIESMEIKSLELFDQKFDQKVVFETIVKSMNLMK